MPSSKVDYSKVSAWRINDFTGIDKLKLSESSIQPPKRKQVAVKIHAVSLNYRDLLVVTGKYPGDKPTDNGGLIPCSDGAGEVVDLGEDVTEWKVGDRVMTTFHTNWEAGKHPSDAGQHALGAALHGALTQIGVFEEAGLVKIPEYLRYEEAATLPCAAVTAWTSLVDVETPVGPHQTVLVQGTGGVSVFAAQIALAAGARVIATSSSDDKMAVYKRLGVREGDLINYSKTPEWGQQARKLAPEGVDHITEVGGSKTMQNSLKAIRKDGQITIIGFVGGVDAMPSVLEVLWSTASIRAVLVGSRNNFKNLSQAFEHHKIKPVIDKVYDFKNAPDAIEHLQSQRHVGKIVIKVA